MSRIESHDVDLEELLMSNSFYSSNNLVSQNHPYSSYNTANSSISSLTEQSARYPPPHPAEDPNTTADDTATTLASTASTSRTSFMKNSPSIKALEHILNEKSRSFNYSLNNLSVQSFQTANESFDRHKIDTIHENDDDNDDTLIEDNSSKSVKNPATSAKALANHVEVESTSSENETHTGPQRPQVPRKSMLEEAEYYDNVKKPSTLPTVPTPKQTSYRQQPTPRLSETPRLPQTPVYAADERTLTSKHQTPTVSGKDIDGNENDYIKSPLSQVSRESPRKSPHLRSNSSFSLNLRKKAANHKRSNTLNDLSVAATEKPEKKKFSFRSLFRKSDKKLTASVSAPNLVSTEQDIKKKHIRGGIDKPTPPTPKDNNTQPQLSRPYTTASIKLPSDTRLREVTSSSDIHFIREVTDDFDDSYDEANLLANAPVKLMNSMFGEEMKLEPSPLLRTPEVSKPVSLDPSNMPTFNTNNPFSTKTDTRYDDIDDDIFGSPLKSNIDQLLGETLFPRTLNPQEIESIVSLEKSRSMRSLRSAKRNSFVNYDGSDENIIISNQMSSPVSAKTVSRSSSILKNGPMKRLSYASNVHESSGEVDNDNDNYTDLIEFTDYIDLDNLNFNTSPNLSLSFNSDDGFGNFGVVPNSPKETGNASIKLVVASPQALQESPIITGNGKNLQRESALPPPDIYTPDMGTNSSPILISSSSSIDEQPLNILDYRKFEEVPAVKSPHPMTPVSTEHRFESLLTPNLEAISPESLRASPGLQDYRLPDTNRPISMSFKGLKAPAFTNNLAARDIRVSGSHQSFNISYDSDYSSQVGDGFGSSDEEDGEDDDDEFNVDSDAEADVEAEMDTYHEDKENHHKNYLGSLIKPPSFHTNKIPAISSNDSSPRSFNSIISKTFRKTAASLGASPIMNSPALGATGVRFSSRIILYETYDCEEYDRHPDTATCNQITPLLAQQIRDELNEIKASMPIHEDSRCYTHFF